MTAKIVFFLATSIAIVLPVDNALIFAHKKISDVGFPTLTQVMPDERVGRVDEQPAPATPTVTESSIAGLVDPGHHSYVVTFVDRTGETRIGKPIAITLRSRMHRVEISNIPTGSSLVIARKIYRSKSMGENNKHYLLTRIDDNTTTSYTDNIPDSGLGAPAREDVSSRPQPQSQAAVDVATYNLNLNRAGIVFTKELRPELFTATVGRGGNVDVGKHEYAITFLTDNGETDGSVYGQDDHSPSAGGVPVAISGSPKQVLLTNLPRGSAVVTGRRIWRSKAVAPMTETEKYFLVATLSDNTTTSYVDNASDASLIVEGRLLHNNSTGGTLKVGTTPAGFIGEMNTVFGFNSQRPTSVGEVNTVFGARAALNNTGDGNSFFGYEAGLGQTTGLLNTGIGLQALSKNEKNSRNTGVGAETLMHIGEGGATAPNNTAVGNDALFLPRAITDNVAIGVNAMRGEPSSTGSENVGIGVSALHSFSTGSHNTVVGWSAFGNLTTGFDNVGIGFQAGSRAIGASRNTFIGTNAGRGATAGSSGSENTAVGMEAGAGFTTAKSNSLVGFSSGNAITSGTQNTALGVQSLNQTTTGSNNVAVGVNAGVTNVVGDNNTLIGSFADIGSNNLHNATAIGAGAVVNQNDSLVLGNNSISVGIGTSTPKAKLDIRGGHLMIGSPGQGIVLKSPDGATCKLLAIDNTGSLKVVEVNCP
jgi:hypothetical protein